MSLRTKLSILISSAIVTVVMMAAVITYQITEQPREGLFEESYAQTVRVLASGRSRKQMEDAGAQLSTRPAPGEVDWEATARLQDALGGQGSELDAMILQDPSGSRRVAIPVGAGEYALLSFPVRPPHPFIPLVSYLAFVILGAGAVSIYGASRLLGPVRLLDNALATLRPDGFLEQMPERGPSETRETARRLNELSRRLISATESRMRLVAAAGHDLRTPMTRMRLRAEFLPKCDRKAWLRDLEELDAIADSAIRLVREEVDLSSFERLSLNALACTVVSELRELGLSAQLDPGTTDLKIDAQPLALKRALRNLADNAARHGGGARLTLFIDGDRAILRIEDDGPGIPEHLLGRVFEPFFRVDVGRGEDRAGAGLGVAIAAEIVARHGGMIVIRNRPEGGLRQDITLVLPRDERAREKLQSLWRTDRSSS